MPCCLLQPLDRISLSEANVCSPEPPASPLLSLRDGFGARSLPCGSENHTEGSGSPCLCSICSLLSTLIVFPSLVVFVFFNVLVFTKVNGHSRYSKLCFSIRFIWWCQSSKGMYTTWPNQMHKNIAEMLWCFAPKCQAKQHVGWEILFDNVDLFEFKLVLCAAGQW